MNLKNITLSKSFRFESAHRLSHGYRGKCRHVHGHSWNGKVTITCHETDSYGMGMDYGVLKGFCTQVENYFDHKLILSTKDEKIEDFIKITEVSGLVVLNDNPTSEVIGMFILDMAKTYFKSMLAVNSIHEFPTSIKITIDETCTSSCEIIENN